RAGLERPQGRGDGQREQGEHDGGGPGGNGHALGDDAQRVQVALAGEVERRLHAGQAAQPEEQQGEQAQHGGGDGQVPPGGGSLVDDLLDDLGVVGGDGEGGGHRGSAFASVPRGGSRLAGGG